MTKTRVIVKAIALPRKCYSRMMEVIADEDMEVKKSNKPCTKNSSATRS